MASKDFEGDAGAPLPDMTARNISMDTIAPALGVKSRQAQPDYLDYGLQRGIASTPSSKFKVQLNSVLNHCGRYGSKAGNTFGVFAVLYSLYEGLGDQVSQLG
jgi:hypothetical protein